jgi:hypothetical protein
MDIDIHRKQCMNRQSELGRVLNNPAKFEEAIKLLLLQHACLHSSQVSANLEWSYEDAILEDLPESSLKHIPKNEEHTIAWCLWHIARIEDVTMNLLLAGGVQIFDQADWEQRLSISTRHTGNAMSAEEIAQLSSQIDIQTLRAYRAEVGRKTRQIIGLLKAEDIKNKVRKERIENVIRAGVVVDKAREIVDYWSRRDTAGLLLMPATRHNLVHLNEALRLKRRFDNKNRN